MNTRLIISFVLSIVLTFVHLLPVSAQRRGISLIRDAEIEALVKDYARPLMKVAGLRSGSVKFYIVNDNSFNAFVNGRGMYINTGLLLQSKTPDEVIGVIAHEIGHLAGGHQARLRERARTARRIATITTLLGVGIGALGSATGNGQLAAAGGGVAAGGSSVAIRGLLSYQRDEETSADHAAIKYLRATKQTGAGMLRTFKRLAEQLSLQGRTVDRYLQSHPMPRERVRTLTEVVKKSPYYNKKPSAALQLRHDLVRAKIAAYVGGTRYAQSLLGDRKFSKQGRLYGRAIMAHLYGSPQKALPLIEAASRNSPKNAYLHEMRGEILLRSGKGKAAAKAFRKAVKLDRYKAGFLRIELAHALLESGGKKNAKQAIIELNKGLARDRDNISGYQLLARAYGEAGNTPRALLASAEYDVRTGRRARAKSYAKRAQKSFKKGSPGWLRAQDILTLK